MEKFYLGLDIGTESVGIACTDENYNLLRAKGKDLWAVRLFDEASAADKRRSFRTARRRTARRAQRIDLLQELFAPYMEDNTFFIRLNNSGFLQEDKDCEQHRLNSRFSLFADSHYTDREFYKAFPTVFHLRSELISSDVKHDLRLYYLAIHHIIKYRGHFLSEGSLSEISDIHKLFDDYNNISKELLDDTAILLPKDKADNFKQLALKKEMNLNDKKRECAKLFGFESKQEKELVALILGGKAKPQDLFNNEAYAEEKSFSFAGLADEAFEAMEEIYNDDFMLLCALRAVYNFIIFEKILSGNKKISDAMVAIYNKHKHDLAALKHFVKTYSDKDTYYKIFKATDQSYNYVNYIGYTKSQKRHSNVKKCTYEDFIKFTNKIIAPIAVNLDANGQSEKNYILSEIGNGSFLPKILNADNGIFPHQINEVELKDIVKNLVRDYPEFGVKHEDGFSAAEKILKIFEYKIPYYVGPVNTYHADRGGTAWAVRAPGKITPWNFDVMVDKAASNEQFIRKMTNKCTYLYGEDVLPKYSILYQKYNLLNQLNKLKINERPLSVELKQRLYNELFLTRKKVSDKNIKDYLVGIGFVSPTEARTLTISGKDGEMQASMSSYILLKEILGDLVDTEPEIAEDIILWHTLNTDKNIVESLILKKYGNISVVKDNIKRIKGITSFKDFGKLSKKFLCGIFGGIDIVTGECYTVLGELYNTNLNLNQILYDDKYTFMQAIEEQNGELSNEIGYEDLENLHLPPQVRRGVWQALKMVDEYVSALNKTPDKVFIEVTRENQEEKQRTVSRKKQILELYKNCSDVEELIDELNAENMTDMRLRSERLYLYFMQLGRCAYTGEQIRLENLNTDIYDVDHILPRSITKDDSLDNKVLVLREKNKQKTDIYPIKVGFATQQAQHYWKVWHEKKLMSDKKYSLLTRTEPLSDEDFRGFINRQLVITSQTVKAVAELLKRKYGEQGCKIVYSKAKNVDDFKQKFSIVKCRETNDLHHARDAYLNIVVGNVYDTVFSSKMDYFYKKNNGEWREYNLKTLFDKQQKGCWDKPVHLSIVQKALAKHSMIVTRYTFINKGEFYNQTVYGKDDSGVAVPRKNCAPYNFKDESGNYKYGGYKSLSTAYFSIVSSMGKKGKRVKTIEAVPVYYNYTINGDIQKLKECFETVVGLKDVEILVPILKIKSLLRVNGFPVRIAGVTGKQILLHNAVQWFTDYNTDKYVNLLLKFQQYSKEGRISVNEQSNLEFRIDTNRLGKNDMPVNAENNKLLYERILQQLDIQMYNGISGALALKNKLMANQEKFVNLSVYNQAMQLLKIVRFLKCNAENPDLSLLNEGANCGILRINQDITNMQVEIIDQSPCGLTERIRKI